jgi:hypothetical protein
MSDPHAYIWSQDGHEYHVTDDPSDAPEGTNACPLAAETDTFLSTYEGLLDEYDCTLIDDRLST